MNETQELAAEISKHESYYSIYGSMKNVTVYEKNKY